MNQELENVTNEPADESSPVVNLSENAPVETPVEPIVEPVVEAVAEPVNENLISAETADSIEIPEEENELAAVEDLPDFASLSKEELLVLAHKGVAEKELEEALQIFKSIKPYLDQHIAEEKASALAKFLEEGGDKDGFEFKGDNSKEEFNQAFFDLKQRKEEARKRQEAEKLENLKSKEAILEEIKTLTESEETSNSLKRLKELREEW
ncbi:MAG: DUF349 domain-containing protein, partial [Bacteroidia bacterium]|nr:DUF349 domain-containing protein [Bacteroidia bacterium]